LGCPPNHPGGSWLKLALAYFVEFKEKFRIAFSTDFMACLILAAMVLWFNYEIVANREAPFFRDLPTYHYPNKFIIAEAFQTGELPLWSRRLSMGFPFLANLAAGVFYPLHLIFLFLPFFDAIRFLFVSHYLIAATGSYLLCRQWNYPPYLALIGSVIFAFGGMTVSLTNMMDYFQTAVWLPWVLFWGERSMRSQSLKDFLPLTLVLLTQFLAGHPETYVMCQGFLFLNGLRIKAYQAELSYHKLFWFLLAANALVAGLGMVQILPAIELFMQSWRSGAIPYSKATVWSLGPKSLINLVFLDKEVDLHAYNGLQLFFGPEPPLLITLYLGAIALPGICLWLFGSPAKEKAILIGLIVMTTILAMGKYTPVYPLVFKYAPLFGFSRFPEKFFFITFNLILFITLSGLFRFLHGGYSLFRGSLLALSSLSLLIFLLPYFFFQFHVDALIQLIAKARQSSPFDVSTSMISAGVLVHLERQIFLTAGIFILLFLWMREKIRSCLFEILFVALAFVDLTSAHRPYHFFLNPGLINTTQRIVSTPSSEPLYRFFYTLGLPQVHPNIYAFIKRPFRETVSSIFSTLIPNAGVFYRVDYMQELESLRRKPYDMFLNVADHLPPEELYRLLGALNVKYLNSSQPLPEGEITQVRHFPEYPSWLYRINNPVPRAYIVPRAVVERDPTKILERLSSKQFNPLEEVVLEQPLSLGSMKDFQAEVRFLRYTNNDATIQTILNSSGVLVLADSFYPGWKVYVDGVETKIMRANYFFRGVLLPPGNHQVIFKYEPASLRYGLIITLTTLILLLSVFIKSRMTRGKSS
jgi:hypothetical protein